LKTHVEYASFYLAAHACRYVSVQRKSQLQEQLKDREVLETVVDAALCSM